MYYRIDLRMISKPHENCPFEPVTVTPGSPMKLRKEVERFAIYFRREFCFDFQQFEAAEKVETGEKAYAAYLFPNERNRYPRVWVGACCFRWRDFEDIGPRWGMQWIWLHPYYRGQGILRRSWEKFHELHWEFIPEGPHSPAMEAFLRKQGNCTICWKPLDKSENLICEECESKHREREQERHSQTSNDLATPS